MRAHREGTKREELRTHLFPTHCCEKKGGGPVVHRQVREFILTPFKSPPPPHPHLDPLFPPPHILEIFCHIWRASLLGFPPPPSNSFLSPLFSAIQNREGGLRRGGGADEATYVHCLCVCMCGCVRCPLSLTCPRKSHIRGDKGGRFEGVRVR